MAHFDVTLSDRSVESVRHADGYEQEGPMTTFFVTTSGHGGLDSWSTRLASFRSAEVLIIRRVDDAAEFSGLGATPALSAVAN